MTPRSACVLLFFSLLPTTMLPQQGNATGTVSGHIYCSDTNLPARLIRVTLLRVPESVTDDSAAKLNPHEPFASVSGSTRIDGSFLISRVPPGTYYVSAEQPGYLTPYSLFPGAELLHPTSEMRSLIARSVPTISVVANKTSVIDVSLQRGGSIAGVIHYDDGSPVSDASVLPLRRDKKGKWTDDLDGSRPTDDLGRFRITGLPAGEYTVSIGLSAPNTGDNDHRNPVAIYYGDGFRETDAKTIKIGEGEDSSGDDITIRLAKLHTIVGSLVDASGHVINAGDVILYTDPDNIEITSAHVEPDDSAFHFDFVPEGNYVIRVPNARDVSAQTVSYPDGQFGPPKVNETISKSYGLYEAPLVVAGDVSGLTITIPAKLK
jgi:hypothetical protein